MTSHREALAEAIRLLGIKQTEAARRIGVSRQHLSAVLNDTEGAGHLSEARAIEWCKRLGFDLTAVWVLKKS